MTKIANQQFYTITLLGYMNLERAVRKTEVGQLEMILEKLKLKSSSRTWKQELNLGSDY